MLGNGVDETYWLHVDNKCHSVCYQVLAAANCVSHKGIAIVLRLTESSLNPVLSVMGALFTRHMARYPQEA